MHPTQYRLPWAGDVTWREETLFLHKTEGLRAQSQQRPQQRPQQPWRESFSPAWGLGSTAGTPTVQVAFNSCL